MRALKNILVTGGAGFIGTNFIRYLFEQSDFDGRVVNLDALTYAGNPLNLKDIEEAQGNRYIFEHGDITNPELITRLLSQYEIDTVVHFAAESHVDRSIYGPQAFVQTNVIGTFTLLEAVRAAWTDRGDVLFHHVSTDEVFGSLGAEGYFTEETPYDPRSPYSASKASSDHFVRAYHETYGLPITVSNCSNNYGPFQFPEKLIPVMIFNMIDGKPLPVYGDGKNIRDWLYVEDHSTAIWAILTKAETGATYNVGGENEWQNIDLVRRLCELVADATGASAQEYLDLISFVTDRPGHDRRYAIDCGKIKSDLGWSQSVTFDQGLQQTIRWYLDNPDWVQQVKSGEYRDWVAKHYGA